MTMRTILAYFPLSFRVNGLDRMSAVRNVGGMKIPSIKLMVLASAAFALATTGGEAAAKEKQQMTLTAASEITFENLVPGQEGGATAATVSGDRNKGEHLTLINLPAGTVGPMHTHSSEVDGVVISGVVFHWHEGETQASAKPLPAGSYFKQPAKIKHYSACAAGADCLMIVFQKGKFDANLIDAPKAAK